jgi:type IV fimbrial biogenesis protein FimT
MHFQLTDTLGGGCALSASGPHWVVSLRGAVGKCNVAPYVPVPDASSPDADAPDADDPQILQTYDGLQAGGDRTVIVAERRDFVFNGLGRFVSSSSANILIAGPEGQEDCVEKGGDTRCLQIEVRAGGGIRLCDPALPLSDPQACS